MSATLSIRIDEDTLQRLDAISQQSKRSKSFLAAEAITAFVAQEEWQLGELRAASQELDAGLAVKHEDVAAWLTTWGTKKEKKAPR